MREDSAWEGKSRSANQRTPIVAPRGGRRGNRPGVTLRRKIKRRACFCGSLRHERTSTREKKCWMRRTRRALLMEDGTCAPLLPLGERVVPSGGAPNGRNGNYNYFLFSFSPFFFRLRACSPFLLLDRELSEGSSAKLARPSSSPRKCKKH